VAKIGVTLNEVLRDFIGQLKYTYDKYFEVVDISEGDVKSLDLIDYFPFKNVYELNKFLYSEASLEVFGHADQLHENVMTLFNNFIMDIEDEEEHEIMLISREANNSIPATLFFLSKLGCKIKDYKFVLNYEDMWNYVDVLITADPKSLESKPTDKVSVKIKSSYNENVESDYEFDTIMDVMNEETINEITKINK